MDITEIIRTRRSIRKFTDLPVSDEIIDKIIEAGTWAPSGMNNQPWKFAVIKDDELKAQISELTHYSKIIRRANVLIAVFLDHSLSYDRTKDCQAVGACLQNMLLTIHSLGLGAVWLGEILKNKDRIRDLIDGPQDIELMAVIALGHPDEKGGKGSRKGLGQTIIFRR
ncbi:MAG: nitroreductase family protein [Nitrospirae bacterium]|nr:nitroreductase family protein [Nitrospirota bacterium]